MRPQPTLEQRIEAYLLDTMSMDERTRFSEEMKLDERLSHEVQLQRAAYAAGEVHAEDRLLKSFARWEWKHSAPRKLFPLVAAATTLVGIAALYLAWTYWPRERDHFADNFETYRAPSNVRGVPSGNAFQAASESYAAGNFDESARLFEVYLADTQDPMASLYAGVSYLSTDAPDAAKAIAHLRIAALSDTIVKQQAEWYLAMAYFEDDDDARARAVLQVMAHTPDHEYAAEAQRILDQL